MFDAVLGDEPARLAALQRLNVLDTAVEEPFEKIVTLVRTVLAVPVSGSRPSVGWTLTRRRARFLFARTRSGNANL
jgi:hypothetical protein